MLSDEEIDKLYEIDNYIEAAEKANVLYIERYDIWQMDRVTLKAFAKLVEARTEERTAAKVRKATLEEMIYSHPTTAIKQAVEYEREECAKVCDELGEKGYVAEGCATAIRARGQT